MLSSLVLHVVAGRGPSRNVSIARRFPLQDVGECTETRVRGADAPQVASAKHVSVNRSSFDFVPPPHENLRAGSKTHTADASRRLGATGDVDLVREFLGGAVGHGHEGSVKARKGARGQEPRSSE